MVINCPKCQSKNPDNTLFCGHCGSSLLLSQEGSSGGDKISPPSMKKLAEGSIFAGRYKIIERLGGGGMGIVYKAEDTKLKRLVALKFLSSDLTCDLQARERFIQEAQAASVLDHPNICTIHEIDVTEEQQMFIVMAYYSGKTLKKKIEQGPLSVREALDIAIQIGEGLKAAHSSGIVHRDIKPANLIVTDDGVVKIVDFGIAKLAGGVDQTRTVEVMGTMAYMSPEQIQNEDIDFRTDIWSTGVVLYEMLTARLPFEGKTHPAFMQSIIHKSPRLLTEIRQDIPLELERLIMRCLRKEPKDRFWSALNLLASLVELKKELEGAKISIRERMPEVRTEIERRQTTVMSAEIIGYDEMPEKLGEEKAVSIMSRISEISGFLKEKYGGQIDRITPSGFMVFFGIPTAVEDAPKRAINAAIELRNRLYCFNQEENLEIPVDIHIGISTGMVIAGAIGTEEQKDYSVMGEAVILASELRAHASLGKILVSAATYRFTKNEFEYKQLKPIPLRGQKEPVAVYELLSVKEKIYRAKLGSERMIESEMIGRDKELDRLEYHLLKAITGKGSIVSVIGEPGIGKSRLIAEFKKKEAIKKAVLLEGRALSIGRSFSFHPIIDIIKNWARIIEEDSASESALKLEKAVREVYPEGATEIFPIIATLMGMKLRGAYAERIKGIEREALEPLIFKNLQELISRAAEQRPLVFILEDLHWADQSSIELLGSLFGLAENNPILYIGIFRPSYAETSEQLLMIIKDRYPDFHSEIVLEALDQSQSESLINNLLRTKALPGSIMELIAKRTEGNPFFIEEVVRSFIDDGLVEVIDGGFRVTEKIDAVVIPETIDEVIMARIDKLDEKTKSLLKVASVIGKTFFYKIIAEVAKTIEELDEKLEYLKDVQLLVERKRLEELEYLFKHALVQEAIYESILLKKRKELHLNIAKAIESIFCQRLHDFYGLLAFHYSLGEDLEKAEKYLVQAGEEALKSSASSEALYYYQEALNMYLKNYGDASDPGRVAMLEKNIALALNNRGQYHKADEYFERVLVYYGVKNPRRLLPVILKLTLAFFDFMISIYFPALRWKKIPTQKDQEIINLSYLKAKALSNTYPKREFVEFLFLMKRFCHFDVTKLEKGFEILSSISAGFSWGGISFKISKKTLEFAKDKVDKKDAKSVLPLAFSELMLNLFSGAWNVVEKYDHNLVNINLGTGEIYFSACYVAFYANLVIEKGNFIFVEEILDKLSEIGTQYENNFAVSVHHRMRTLYLMKFRKLSDALDESEKGIDFANKTGFKAIFFATYSLKARIQILGGDFRGAENTLQYLAKIKPEINLAPLYISHFLLSQFILSFHKLEESLKIDKKAEINKARKKTRKMGKLAIKNSRKLAYEKTEIFKLMGTYYWLVNKQKKALKWWEKSIREGEQLGAIELPRTFMEVGKRLSEKKSRYEALNGVTASEYLEKAKALFMEMELQWDLEELNRAEIDLIN